MDWHLQPVRLVARAFDVAEGGSDKAFSERADFAGIASVEILGGTGVAFIQGMKTDGNIVDRRGWRNLLKKLREQYGIHTVRCERGDHIQDFPTAPPNT